MKLHSAKRNTTIAGILFACHIFEAFASDQTNINMDQFIDTLEAQCQRSTFDRIIGKGETHYKRCMRNAIQARINEIRSTVELKKMNDQLFRKRLNALESASNQYAETEVDQSNQLISLSGKLNRSSSTMNDVNINVVEGYLLRSDQSQ